MNTLGHLYLQAIRQEPKSKLMHLRVGNQFSELLVRRWDESVRKAFSAFIRLKIGPKSHVLFLGNDRPEWLALDFACMATGAVSIACPEHLPLREIQKTVSKYKCKLVVAAGTYGTQKALKLGCQVLVIDSGGIANDDIYYLKDQVNTVKNSRLFEKGLLACESHRIFTRALSGGVTDKAKWVALTHHNVMSVLNDLAPLFPKKERALIQLSWAQTMGRVTQFFGLAHQWTLCFPSSFETTTLEAKTLKPTLLISSPTHLEATRKMIELKSSSIVATMLRNKVKRALGKHVRRIISSGSALPPDTQKYFQAANIPVIEAYELTVAASCVAIGLLPNGKPAKTGSVGRPLGEVSVRTGPDSELWVKSDKLSPDAELISGWYRTGDIGVVDSEGFIFIKDRKQNLIKSQNLEPMVSPSKIEERIKQKAFQQGLIKHVVVVSTNPTSTSRVLTAILTLDREGSVRFARKSHILFSNFSSLAKNPKIQAAISLAIESANQELASHEQIGKFLIVSDIFSPESGELTANLKIKRTYIAKKYQKDLTRLYSNKA